MAEILWSVNELMEDAETGGWGGGFRAPEFDLQEFVETSACCIRRLGWVPRSRSDPRHPPTSSCVLDILVPPFGADAARLRKRWMEENKLYVNDKDKELAEAAIEWGKGLPTDQGDYLYNLGVAIRNDVVLAGSKNSTVGLVASLVSAYQRAMQRERDLQVKKQRIQTQQAISQHLGTVGERKGFVGLIVRAIREFPGDYGVRTMIRFEDPDGNILVWWKSGESDKWIDDSLENQTSVDITATIKKHDQYQGVAQTIIARTKEGIKTPKKKKAKKKATPSVKGVRKCGNCGEPGHNKRTCTKKTSKLRRRRRRNPDEELRNLERIYKASNDPGDAQRLNAARERAGLEPLRCETCTTLLQHCECYMDCVECDSIGSYRDQLGEYWCDRCYRTLLAEAEAEMEVNREFSHFDDYDYDYQRRTRKAGRRRNPDERLRELHRRYLSGNLEDYDRYESAARRAQACPECLGQPIDDCTNVLFCHDFACDEHLYVCRACLGSDRSHYRTKRGAYSPYGDPKLDPYSTVPGNPLDIFYKKALCEVCIEKHLKYCDIPLGESKLGRGKISIREFRELTRPNPIPESRLLGLLTMAIWPTKDTNETRVAKNLALKTLKKADPDDLDELKKVFRQAEVQSLNQPGAIEKLEEIWLEAVSSNSDIELDFNVLMGKTRATPPPGTSRKKTTRKKPTSPPPGPSPRRTHRTRTRRPRGRSRVSGVCIICGLDSRGKPYCRRHYYEFIGREYYETCTVAGCDAPSFGQPKCREHYYGDRPRRRRRRRRPNPAALIFDRRALRRRI